MKLPSGSKLGLAMKCLGSVVLPQVVEEVGQPAIEGTKKHATLETYFKEGRVCPESFTAEERELCASVERTIDSYGVRPELSAERPELGLYVDPSDWMAGIFVPRGNANESISLDSDSSNHGSSDDLLVSDGSFDCRRISEASYDDWRANKFVSVADLVRRHSASEFAVWDWKFGSYVPSPEYNWQLLLSAISLWIINGRDSEFLCHVGIVYCGDATDGDGIFRAEHAKLGASELAAAESKLRLRWMQLLSLSPESVTLYEGKHCQYCPARHRCPAKVGAIAEAIRTVWSYNGTEGPSQLEVVKASMTLMDSKPQIDKAAKNILKEHGGELDLGDGRVAVLKKDALNREKIYTRHAKNTAGSNASEDGESGSASEGTGTS